jgi:hypothetical protein
VEAGRAREIVGGTRLPRRTINQIKDAVLKAEQRCVGVEPLLKFWVVDAGQQRHLAHNATARVVLAQRRLDVAQQLLGQRAMVGGEAARH